MKILDWGCVDYKDALQRQLALVDTRIADGCEDTLIFCEHFPIYTLGTRQNAPLTPSINGVACVHTGRGGDITYHGPGQCVVYPILKLKDGDLHRHVRNLEYALIKILALYNIVATRRPSYTGAWIDNAKIASIGIAVRRYVTYHGLALNVNNDLAPFDAIVPCGIPNVRMTSMQAILNQNIDMDALKKQFYDTFNKITLL